MIVAGAAAFFISNLLMQEILAPMQYGQYSIFVTYFSLIYVLGVLGTEQGFLRFSKTSSRNFIETQKTQLILISCIVLLTTILGSFLFKIYYSEIPVNSVLLFFATFSMVGLLFLFNVLRLNSDFIVSQFIANYWKIIMLLLSLFFWVTKTNKLEFFIEVITINVILIFFGTLFYILKKIKINFNNDISNRNIFITAFHFFLAIFSFSLIVFADRFIIEMKFSTVEFGNFFYLTNFFLAPFTILQNYIGFKQLIVFKNHFNKAYYIKFNRRVILLGSILGVILFLCSFVLCYFKILKFDFDTYYAVIILLLFIGVLRLYSSSIVSAFEARTTIKTLRNANVIILITTIVILMIAILTAESIETVLICTIIIWLLRSIVHRQLILHQIKNNK